MLSGDLRPPGSVYCEFLAIGEGGRLWRRGDRAEPPLLMDVGTGWRPVALTGDADQSSWDSPWVGELAYRRFARMIREDASHPLCGDSALADLEIVMSVYESARTHTRIKPPLEQERFPLELMIEAGQI